jgi:hypothetical protein
MLLVLTNSQDVTASFLCARLKEADIPFLRLDTDQLVPQISFSYRVGSPALKVDGEWIGPDEITNIWYRRPEVLKSPQFDGTPEGKYALAEWTEFTECFFAHIPRGRWMNHPAANARASRKLEQITTAKSLGFSVPDTLVTQEPDDLVSFYKANEKRIIVKPVSTGYVERPMAQQDSLVYTNRVLEEHLKDLSDLKVCPALFQQCIQKDYDVRITSVDDDVHAVALFASDDSGSQRCDIRRNNMVDVRYKSIELPEVVKNGISNIVKHYGLRFSAIDMAVTNKGEWCFFEINANGQWAWLDQCAGTNIAGSFVRSFSQGG